MIITMIVDLINDHRFTGNIDYILRYHEDRTVDRKSVFLFPNSISVSRG